jgi:hypothetical protein
MINNWDENRRMLDKEIGERRLELRLFRELRFNIK